jgi:putative glycosyltransferase (TIGR04348 family)
MIALHARRSFDSIARYAEAFPERPLVVVLTGTDVYRDIQSNANAKRSLELATRLVVLQEMALNELSPRLRAKSSVIYQSAPRIEPVASLTSCFELVVSGHLRAEKDPFRTAAALQYLTAGSRVRVTHIGGALEPDMADEARGWMAREDRYRWLGELSHARALRLLSRARLMVISSRMEGGANVVSEALTAGVPVIASRIAGNIGMLGADYPGYYTCGSEQALAKLISRAERDAAYYSALAVACRKRAALVTPGRERKALCELVDGSGMRSMALRATRVLRSSSRDARE